MTANLQLVRGIRQVLAANANPARAEGMRAYMKSEMPCRGVQTPVRRRLVNGVMRSNPIGAKEDWRRSVLELWREAGYREERYAALDVAGAGHYKAFRTPDTLPMFEEMVVTGAWWDYVAKIRQGPGK